MRGLYINCRGGGGLYWGEIGWEIYDGKVEVTLSAVDLEWVGAAVGGSDEGRARRWKREGR